MKLIQKFVFLLCFFLSFSCSKEERVVDKIEEGSIDLQMIKAYEEGMNELDNGVALVAA